MSVGIDPALVAELTAHAGACEVEVVGAPDKSAVEHGFRVAAQLLREVPHPEEPEDPLVHDTDVRRGPRGSVLWFDAADAEAYPGLLEALVERVVAGLDRAGVTEGLLRAVSPAAATDEPPPEVAAAAMNDRSFLREQLEGFPWPLASAQLSSAGEGPPNARRRSVTTSSPVSVAEALHVLTTGLARSSRFTLLGVDHETTPDGTRDVVTFSTPACAGRASLLAFGGRVQLQVVLDPPPTR